MTCVESAGSDSISRPRSEADVRGSSNIQRSRIAAPGCTGSWVTSVIRSFASAVAIVLPPLRPAAGHLRVVPDLSYIGHDRQPLREISGALRFGPDEPDRSPVPNHAPPPLRAADHPRPGRL